MSEISWRVRAFTPPEAAEICGVSAGAVRLLLHRHAKVGLGERRRGRRRLSARDIATLRVALYVNRAMPMAEALPAAAQHLERLPSAAAFLVAEGGKTFTADAETAGRWAVERGAVVVPFGRIAHDILAMCSAPEGAA
ncbi:hypothetical protein [Amorphus orientalis]|uniref:Uncharacterized protein n=1 Tax=Amorphus orientalis TaxID=649198 RepID=A0AAE3VSG1_9HYPH|nr:hypothetical protein [Amorphus orientalis]MDQ0317360.1 hypothetical protein [Amorphus orientalis]